MAFKMKGYANPGDSAMKKGDKSFEDRRKARARREASLDNPTTVRTPAGFDDMGTDERAQWRKANAVKFDEAKARDVSNQKTKKASQGVGGLLTDLSNSPAKRKAKK